MTDIHIPELVVPPSASPDEVVQHITAALDGLTIDASYREGMSRAVPGARLVYGVRVPQLRQLAGQVLQKFKKQPVVVDAIADGCWQAGSREHCVLAILVLAGLKTLTPAERWKRGVRYLPDVSDWETCDQLCMGLLGQALAEDPAYMQVLERWVDDSNVWIRRAALASTVVLRRSKAAPAMLEALNQRTLGICLRLLDDNEHYIRKAVDWAVREVLRRDYELGKQWLMERGKGELSAVARSTLKKSAKKLLPDDQEQFLRQIS
jgi:3-methyladenine DNA glycosylase AlkD